MPFVCPTCRTESPDPLAVFDGYCAACGAFRDDGTFFGRLYDENGDRVRTVQWLDLAARKEHGYGHVARDTVSHYEVVTDWVLGQPLPGVSPDGAPLLFETMVTDSVSGEQTFFRYASKRHATEGHAEVCRRLTADMN